jgi:peptidoglycan hydrolase-like protein with peptidoglycan-binding domain
MRLMFQGCPPGPDVRTIQNRLNQAGTKTGQTSKLPSLAADGVFGAKTAQRVVEFQARNGLTIDGVVGPKTEGTLNDLLGSPTHLTPPHVPPKPAAPTHAPLAGHKALAKQGPGFGARSPFAPPPSASPPGGPNMVPGTPVGKVFLPGLPPFGPPGKA